MLGSRADSEDEEFKLSISPRRAEDEEPLFLKQLPVLQSCMAFWQRPLEFFFQNILKGAYLAGTELNMRLWRPFNNEEQQTLDRWQARLEKRQSILNATPDPVSSTLPRELYLLAIFAALEKKDEQAAALFKKAKEQGCHYIYVRMENSFQHHAAFTLFLNFEAPFSEQPDRKAGGYPDPEKIFLQGEYYARRNNWANSLPLYCQAAKRGHAVACSRIAQFLSASSQMQSYTKWQAVLPEELHGLFDMDDSASSREVSPQALSKAYLRFSLARGNFFSVYEMECGFVDCTSLSRQANQGALQLAAEWGDYRAAKVLYYASSKQSPKQLWLRLGAENGSDELLLALGKQYLTAENEANDLSQALTCLQKVRRKNILVVDHYRSLMVEAHRQNAQDVFFACCRDLAQLLSGQLDYSVPSPIGKRLHDALWKLYEDNSQDVRLVYYVAIVLEALPQRFLRSCYSPRFHNNAAQTNKKSLKTPFNQFAKRALAGKLPLFLGLLGEGNLRLTQALLEPQLHIPFFRYFAEFQKHKQMQRKKLLGDYLTPFSNKLSAADLVLEYVGKPESTCTEIQATQVNAFIKIHCALIQGQSGYVSTRVPCLEYLLIEDALSMIEELSQANNTRCQRGWELAQLYSDLTNEDHYKKLVREIYKFSFDHSGWGIIRRARFAGLTFYRSESLKSYFDKNPDLFSQQNMQSCLVARDNKPLDARAQKIGLALK